MSNPQSISSISQSKVSVKSNQTVYRTGKYRIKRRSIDYLTLIGWMTYGFFKY